MSRKYLVFALTFVTAAAITIFITRIAFPKKAPVAAPVVNETKGRDAAPVPAVTFTDITRSAGITFKHVNGATGFKILPETMSGGVAIFDFDGDGDQDILFVQSGELPGAKSPDRHTMALYRNTGGAKFEDVTMSMGLALPGIYGMGVCVGDIDNDGWPDLFISAVGKHRLFRNVEGKKFEDISHPAGIVGGPDMPQVTREQFGEWKPPIQFGSSCTFLDYDGDGLLDLFVCQYIEWSPRIDRNISASLAGVGRAYVPPRDFNGAQCTLYRNVDGKRFEDVSAKAGVLVERADGTGPNARKRAVGKCLGVVACDPDGDGWSDLIVANDGTPNFFFHNRADKDGNRYFVECGGICGVALPDDATARGGMGIDYGEYLPGQYAAVIANFANEPDTFLRLRPAKPNAPRDLIFSDLAVTNGLAGPSRTPLKFGAFFFDYDLDGRLDLLTCNGHIEPEIGKTQGGQSFAQQAQLFWNTGLDRPLFEPVTEATAGPGMFKPIVGRGCAYGDLDNDGDLDVVLCENNGPPIVLRNDNDLKNNWARFTLKGDGKRTNRLAIGATVTLTVGETKYVRTVVSGRGYLSQCELPLTFGLGKATKIDKVEVRWPGKDGQVEQFAPPAVNSAVELVQGKK